MTTTFRKTDFMPAGVTTPTKTGARKLVIAVDGPAASGKGTLALKLAQRMGLAYLDTGALYRAVALATIETGGDCSQMDDVTPALAIIKRNLTPELLSNPALRTDTVAQGASKVAALGEVRLELLDFQRDFARNPLWAFDVDGNLTTAVDSIGGCVLDGRDIGTVVCPDADFKFFVSADVKVRAERRLKELQARGKADGLTIESVTTELKERDARDSLRKIAPTIPADDAYHLDSSVLNANEVLDEAMAIIRARILAETNV